MRLIIDLGNVVFEKPIISYLAPPPPALLFGSLIDSSPANLDAISTTMKYFKNYLQGMVMVTTHISFNTHMRIVTVFVK